MTCNCIGGNPCPCQRGRYCPSGFGVPMAPELAKLLEMARQHVMTPKERYEQTISWIRGMSGKLSEPMPSREEVVRHLEQMGVIDPSPDDIPESADGR